MKTRIVFLLFVTSAISCTPGNIREMPQESSGEGIVGLVVEAVLPFNEITFWRDGHRQQDVRITNYPGGLEVYVFRAPAGYYCLEGIRARYRIQNGNGVLNSNIESRRSSNLCFRLEAGKFGFGGHLLIPQEQLQSTIDEVFGPEHPGSTRSRGLTYMRLLEDDADFRALLQEKDPDLLSRYGGETFQIGKRE